MVVIEGGRERERSEREGVICYGCDVIAMVMVVP